MVVSPEKAKEIRTDALDLLNDESLDVYDQFCTEKPGMPGVGLWQWVVASSDGNISIKTNHTVCRYGKGHNLPPKCPWNACRDDRCDRCIDGFIAKADDGGSFSGS